MIDVVGVLQHWHAGRPEAVVAASLGGREDGPQVRPSPPRRRGSGRVMTTSWTGPAGRPGVAGGRSTSLRAYFVERAGRGRGRGSVWLLGGGDAPAG